MQSQSTSAPRGQEMNIMNVNTDPSLMEVSRNSTGNNGDLNLNNLDANMDMRLQPYGVNEGTASMPSNNQNWRAVKNRNH